MRFGTSAKQNPLAEHDDSRHDVEPAICCVHWDEVSNGCLVNQESIEPDHQIEDAPADEVVLRPEYGSAHDQAGCSGEQVDNVVQDGCWQDTQKCCDLQGRAVVAYTSRMEAPMMQP